ncbi:MAG: peptidase, partial [Gammaproteobacteria bacterium]|nr:peptidase [Gammaproteobacteria bacterium]
TFANMCASPRSGVDINGDAFPDQTGSILYENHWLRSWSNDTYLWYDELPDINPSTESNPTDYFDLLKTSATTASGNDKDNFHFFRDTAEYLQSNQSGISVSYGFNLKLIGLYPYRELYISYIEPESPAAALALNLSRGTQIIEIDGYDVATENSQEFIEAILAVYYPSADGESHTFTVRDIGASQAEDRQITLQATEVTADPVPMVDTFSTAS